MCSRSKVTEGISEHLGLPEIELICSLDHTDLDFHRNLYRITFPLSVDNKVQPAVPECRHQVEALPHECLVPSCFYLLFLFGLTGPSFFPLSLNHPHPFKSPPQAWWSSTRVVRSSSPQSSPSPSPSSSQTGATPMTRQTLRPFANESSKRRPTSSSTSLTVDR